MAVLADAAAQRLEAVLARIRAAEAACGRPAGSVRLLAVSKTHGADLIRAVYAAGQRAFGENYLQEALAKQAELVGLDVEWHYIGRIQSNKTRSIAEHFDWVHGVADARHARRLSEQRPGNLAPLNICLQVNVSGEASKGGAEPDQVAELAAACRALPRLRLRGLMAIPEPAHTVHEQRKPFAALRALRDRLATPDLPLDTLSMGMTADLEAAVSEGATVVRIGTAIFGSRSYVEH